MISRQGSQLKRLRDADALVISFKQFGQGGFIGLGPEKDFNAGAVTGTGVEKIDAGAALEFDAGVSGGQTISFSANVGNLALLAPASFGATILGFAPGNQIDLVGMAANAVSYQSNVLTVKNGKYVPAM